MCECKSISMETGCNLVSFAGVIIFYAKRVCRELDYVRPHKAEINTLLSAFKVDIAKYSELVPLCSEHTLDFSFLIKASEKYCNALIRNGCTYRESFSRTVELKHIAEWYDC